MKTKSCKLDMILTTLLKRVLPTLRPIITRIVNLSLSSRNFCTEWKTAIVRSLLKKLGLEFINSNYRPVSNLTFISKLVEKAMLIQFNQHCDGNQILPDYQSAYRKDHSCETSLMKIFNDILWGMECKEVTAMTVMDLSAAFDTVDHEILLKVLHDEIGITGQALDWFDSYLRPRFFKVCVDGYCSDKKELKNSVPQGSGSGANIFTVYATSLN